jgi:serine/threonine-protein kinase
MQTGDVLAGQYRLCEQVGSGGFGTVWRAEELRGGRAVVAVKVFHCHPDEAEMAMLARLEHPHVLRYRTTIVHEGRLCLLTDFADGGDVESLWKAAPQGLPLEQARAILLGVARALQYLHGQRIVHRDVKPANVLLVGGTVRLADVGLAQALDQVAARLSRTPTPAYAAPELHDGVVADPKVDIYAWGVTAFEVLAGAPLFTGSPYQVIDSHRHAAPPPLPERVPAPLRSLVARCLEKAPEQRPTADELVATLAGEHPGPAAPTPAPAAEPPSAAPERPARPSEGASTPPERLPPSTERPTRPARPAAAGAEAQRDAMGPLSPSGAEVRIKPFRYVLKPGDYVKLEARVKLADGVVNSEVTWSSADTRIAKIHPREGKVLALAPGRVLVTAAYDRDPRCKATLELVIREGGASRA